MTFWYSSAYLLTIQQGNIRKSHVISINMKFLYMLFKFWTPLRQNKTKQKNKNKKTKKTKQNKTKQQKQKKTKKKKKKKKKNTFSKKNSTKKRKQVHGKFNALVIFCITIYRSIKCQTIYQFKKNPNKQTNKQKTTPLYKSHIEKCIVSLNCATTVLLEL